MGPGKNFHFLKILKLRFWSYDQRAKASRSKLRPLSVQRPYKYLCTDGQVRLFSLMNICWVQTPIRVTAKMAIVGPKRALSRPGLSWHPLHAKIKQLRFRVTYLSFKKLYTSKIYTFKWSIDPIQTQCINIAAAIRQRFPWFQVYHFYEISNHCLNMLGFRVLALEYPLLFSTYFAYFRHTREDNIN